MTTDILDEHIELNMCNYDHDDVAKLNAWAIQACEEIERLRKAKRIPKANEEAEHTPGPWRVGRRVEGQRSVEAPMNRKAHADDDGFRIVATVRPSGSGGRADGEWKASVNARLIAAAPELLDALRRIIRCHDEGCDEQWEKLIDIGRAAVAKATGAAPVPS